MATFSATFEERNDASALVVTDTSTDFWGESDGEGGQYPEPGDIIINDGGGEYLLLDITVTTSDGTETTYDTIDLYDEFGAFTDESDLVYTITPTMLKESGTSSFTSTSKLPDGIYEITYTVEVNTAGYSGDTTDYDILLDGQVRADVYDMLRTIPNIYELQGDIDSRDVREAMFAYSYLTGMKASSYVALSENLLNQLSTLEEIVRNGSNATW